MKNLALAVAMVFYFPANAQLQGQIPPPVAPAQPVLVPPVPVQYTDQSIVQAAQRQRDKAEEGARMNQMMGFMMLAMCAMGMAQGSGSQPGAAQGGAKPAGQPSGGGMNMANILPCLMGALMLVQANKQKEDAAETYQSQIMAANRTGMVPAAYLTPAGMPPNAAAGLNYLNGAGYRVSAAGVTLPNGRVLPSSAFSSPSGLAAYGVSPAAFQQAQAHQARFQEQAARHIASEPRD